MKKLIIIIAVILTAMNGYAQESKYYNTKHEVGIAIGAGTTTEIFSGLADFTSITISSVVSTAITGGLGTGSYSYGDEHYIPALSAEYFYHVTKGVALGGIIAFNGMDRDMYMEWRDNVKNDLHKDKTGKARRRNISIIPAAKFDWLRKKYFGMYSKLGVGISFMYESQKDDRSGGTDYSKTTVIPNIQASLLGLETGTQNIRGFIELGFGEQGILLGGLKYKF